MTKEAPNNVHTFKNFISIYNKNEMSKKLTTEEFIKKSQNVHGKKYDYSLVKYINNHTKVQIICPTHGLFEQLPNDHTSKKCGCYRCSGHGTSTEEFISKCVKIHGNKYDYSKTKFRGVDKKITIICKKHGDFLQSAYGHSVGNGCKKCRSELLSQKQKLTIKEFIDKANKIHNYKFDYSKTNYTIGKNKLYITCPKHGEFYQQAQAHLQGKGCPTCKESVGERKIRMELERLKIKYECQKRFMSCINQESKRQLPFDFYLPDFNVCIEYHGKQHYSIKHGYFGAKKNDAIYKHERLKNNDKLKSDFCDNNNIKLVILNSSSNIEKELNSLCNIN